MDISIFDVIGPVMVGPSSSHTAGAVRLGRMGKMIAQVPFSHVSFGLHGSFAKTYQGHGTDRALVAGVLGLSEQDERITQSFELANQQSLTYEFCEVELEYMHENSVQMTFQLETGTTCEVIGSSIGGGQVVIRSINGFDVEFSGTAPTLILQHNDQKGTVSQVAHLLALNDINIAVMKLSRTARGAVACWIIETDSLIPGSVMKQIMAIPNMIGAQVIQGEPSA